MHNYRIQRPTYFFVKIALIGPLSGWFIARTFMGVLQRDLLTLLSSGHG
jgi:hypothetical protein